MGKASIQSRSNPRVVIDARPQGPRGALALESLEGGSVLDHLLAIASTVGSGSSSKAIVFTSSEDAPAWAGTIKLVAKARIDDPIAVEALTAAEATANTHGVCDHLQPCSVAGGKSEELEQALP